MSDTKTLLTPDPSRRRLLRGAVALAGTALCGPALAMPSDKIVPERRLRLVNLHTNESLDTIYWAQGGYIDEALEDINYVLRDFRQDETHIMSPRLIDLLYKIQSGLGNGKPLQIISGYRSPKTNEMLRRNTHGVAKSSLHMQGQATDIRLQGVELKDLRDFAQQFRQGGVGYYPDSNFVHVDVGAVRTWVG